MGYKDNTLTLLWNNILTVSDGDHRLEDLFLENTYISFSVHNTAASWLQARDLRDNVMVKEVKIPWVWHAVSSVFAT